MEIVLADAYGFCFGVRRAVDGVYNAVAGGKVVTTLGPVTHNKAVVRDMQAKGARITDSVAKVNDGIVIIRAHGEPPRTYKALWDKKLDFIDLTCPCVKANQKLAKAKYDEDAIVIIAGDANHPEIVGINGWIDDNAIIIRDAKQVDGMAFDDNRQHFLMSQTTFSVQGFQEITKKLQGIIKNLEIFNTICVDTQKKQAAAENLARQVDKMIVIGDADSSNSRKLYDICRAVQKNTYFIESIDDLQLKNFAIDDRIGITAGASTPPATIEEAVKRMSEFEKNLEEGAIVPEITADEAAAEVAQEAAAETAQEAVAETTTENAAAKGENFEEMLDESITSLHTGQIVKGKVISVVNGEVMVDLQFKSDGIIQRNQFSDNPDIDPAEVVKPGDEIEVFVLRVNDGDGNVLLSKKRIDAQKGYKDIEEAFMHELPIAGKVTEVVKGGVIANIAGVRAFVPASQVSERFSKDLSVVLDQTFNFMILELDKSKRPWRIIAGRRALAAKEAQEKKDAAMAGLEEGIKVTGQVSSIAAFGAFVDLGGVDGLIHVSELSWGRVKKVSDVLKEGDTVEAYVIKLDKDKGKVSLSLKDINSDPWNAIEEKYPIGSIVEGKVVRMVNFGAFVVLEDGVDGLVHISQIAHKHVNKPEEELTAGQVVQVKVTDLNLEAKKISLSIKEAAEPDYDDDYDDDYYDDDYDDDDYDDDGDYDDDEVVEAVEATEAAEEAEETVVQEAIAEEVAVEEAIAEEVAVEEAIAEEVVVEEAVAEETAAEEIAEKSEENTEE
ncbi:MAG: bifunctional 4-hydroxy-3-methylbut-2-enyl diphosphate reductase/30S ribosomal protein S1 [Clostridiales bacterium]|jgi:4-hydroxy-3-methylbut-2-enyl diphosphate reductase|nr:bifunctional 4-hydroxy-3-methylbut-2-enyl diphosphate reductase/30S ribosomal protein S1 [Clostridiales bacterium]